MESEKIIGEIQTELKNIIDEIEDGERENKLQFAISMLKSLVVDITDKTGIEADIQEKSANKAGGMLDKLKDIKIDKEQQENLLKYIHNLGKESLLPKIETPKFPKIRHVNLSNDDYRKNKIGFDPDNNDQ